MYISWKSNEETLCQEENFMSQILDWKINLKGTINNANLAMCHLKSFHNMFVPTILAFCMLLWFWPWHEIMPLFMPSKISWRVEQIDQKLWMRERQKTAVKILRDYIKRGKENKLLNIIKMKSYLCSSHFASLFFTPIKTGVFISKRVYYPHNVMVSARKNKNKINDASLLSISFVSPCYI